MVVAERCNPTTKFGIQKSQSLFSKITFHKTSQIVLVQEFLLQFSKMQLARCNFHCGEYPRALMYFEDYIAEHPDQMKGCLSFLAEVDLLVVFFFVCFYISSL